METVYGIVSDIHQSDPVAVKNTLNLLKDLGATQLILNGDLTGEASPLLSPRDYLYYVLKAAADTNLETQVQFGSHEEYLSSEQVLHRFARLYGNIINVREQRRKECSDHHLVFLPGSDWNAGGEYTFGTSVPSGTYIKLEEGLLPFESPEQYHMAVQQGKAQSILHYENIDDLKKYVADPEKTIVICHVPPQFSGLKHAIDWAVFGLATQGFNLGGDQVPAGTVFPGPVAEKLKQSGAPVVLKEENRGNEALAALYRELGIRKAINGHFHESAHHAHNQSGIPVPQGIFIPSLFWNASYLDGRKAGLLKVKETLVSYHNVDLRRYGIH